MSSLLDGAGLGLVLVEFGYEYQGRDGDLVSIRPNERYVLLAKTNAHWWQVRRHPEAKPFYVPAKYVKELPAFPSPLDFAAEPLPSLELPLSLEPLPAVAPPSGSAPRPKTLDRAEDPPPKPGDEVTIRLRSDAGTYRKVENRMSTFGFALEPPDPGTPNAPGGTTNMAELGGALAQPKPGGAGPRVPSFSPADPLLPPPRHHTQPKPVETPVVPPLVADPSTTTKDEQWEAPESPLPQEQEEEEEDDEEVEEEKESNHIYESIQDLNLDVDALTAHTHTQFTVDACLPIHANSADRKCSSGPHLSDSNAVQHSGPTLSVTEHAPSSPVSLQNGWQVHTDRDSGQVYYYHPITGQTTWTDPRSTTPPLSADMECSSRGEGLLTGPSPLLSPASSQGSCGWEQLVDGSTGRLYYYDPISGSTSWVPPGPLSPAFPEPGADGPPPLPEEDYPIDDQSETDTQGSRLDERRGKEGSRSHTQPQRILGNGVSDAAALTVKGWRHSMTTPPAEDKSFSSGLKRNLSDASSDTLQCHLLEKAGILNKTKVADNGKRIRKNWAPSWTVLHGGILTFHKDPKTSNPSSSGKTSHIIPEYTVDLRGASLSWASRDKSSKKNVLELRTRQGCEYLVQYDTDSIILDWNKVLLDSIKQLEQEHVSEEEEDDEEEKNRISGRPGSSEPDPGRVRTKLRRFLQRRPTLQSVKEKGYIRDNVFGCHLDTLCHRENSTIPKFVEKCIRAVERRGLDVDGIYRVSGNLAVIQKLRHKADHEEDLDLEDGQWEEVHVITGALKLFFRELPEPLFPFSCFDKFIAAISEPQYSDRVSFTKDLISLLPLPNHSTMHTLFTHLRRVIDHGESNRMSVQSIAIVFGPTLLRPQTESSNLTVNMVFQSQIVELILNEFPTIFPPK